MSQKEHFLNLQQLTESDSFILFYSSQILLRDEQILWNLNQIAAQLNDSVDLILLQEKAGVSVIAVNLQQDISELLQAELVSLRSLLFFADQETFLLAGRGSQLVDWYKNHQFCGRCGGKTAHLGAERALVCEVCALHFFPRISPCVIMLVSKGDKMLLAQGSRHKSNYYSCLAGFIEIGETAEEAVHREVREEVSLEVTNLRYISSQSWPFPSQLMLGFLAEYAGGEIVPEPSEILDAKWFDIDSLPNIPSEKHSISGKLIQVFIDECQKERAG